MKYLEANCLRPVYYKKYLLEYLFEYPLEASKYFLWLRATRHRDTGTTDSVGKNGVLSLTS